MKSKKLFAILTLMAFMMTLLPLAAFATSVTQPVVAVADNYIGKTTTYTITFTATTALAAGNSVIVSFPADTDVTGVATGVTVNGAAAGGVAVAGQDVDVSVPADIAANGAVTVVIPNVKNPTTHGLKTLTVETTTDTDAVESAKYSIVGGVANRYASTVSLDKTDLVADGDDYIKVTVNVADAGGRPVDGQVVYVATDRGIERIQKYDTILDVSTTGIASVNGKAEFQVKAVIAGQSKLGVGFKRDELIKYLQGQDGSSAAAAELVGSVQTINIQSASVGGVTLIPTGSVVADGITKMSVVAEVKTLGGEPVKDQAVTFSANKTGLTFDKTSYTTDAFGRVTAKVTSTKSGEYRITAKAGGKSASQDYVFTASTTAYNIELVKSPDGPIAKGVTSSKAVKVKVTDINGNRIKTGTPVKATIETKPTGGTGSVVLNAENVDSNGDWQYDVTLNREGSYKLRFALDNGKMVEPVINVQEQGEVVKLELSYDQKSMFIDANKSPSGRPTVKRIDAAGVSVTVNLPESIQFSSSNPALATVHATTGIIQPATTDPKDAGTVVITAIDTINNLVASTEMPLYGQPVGFTATAPDPVEVNVSAPVTIQFVDKNGNEVALGPNANLIKEYTVVSSPADAGINVSFAGDADTKLQQTGATTVNISSTVAGDVTVQLRIFDAAAAGGAGVWYTTPVTVKVGAAKPVIGASKIILFIGNTGYSLDNAPKVMDVPPQIKDGRTLVPVRAIAEAFGCAVEWNEATQTVTLTRDDMVQTIVIGSDAMTVVADGVTTTIELDVPAEIIDGRTMLPLRAIGEAFGAAVNYDADTNSITIEQ